MVAACSPAHSSAEKMFKREYQGGSHVMVVSAVGRDPMAHCKVMGSVSHRYDKVVRGYVHVMEGDSITTKIQLPGNDRSSLGLLQPFLVLQVSVPTEARFTVELSLLDGKGGKRRVLFSSSVREPSISPLIARVPLIAMTTGQWVNVCFDLPSLVAKLFPGHTHKSLESLVVGGACQIRRVFTMRDRPRESRQGSDLVSESGARDIPSACQMTIDHTPIPTQVMSFITNNPQPKSSSQSVAVTQQPPAASGRGSRPHPPLPTHVAFGKKVVIPEHIRSREVTSRSAGNSRRKGRSLVSVASAPRQSSAPSSVRGGVATVEGVGVGLDGRSHQPTRQAHRESGEEGGKRKREGGVGRRKGGHGERREKPKTHREPMVLTDGDVDSERVLGGDVRTGDTDARQRRSPGEGGGKEGVSPLERDVLLALDVLRRGGEDGGEGWSEGGGVGEGGGGWSEGDLRGETGGLELRQTTSTPELGVAVGHGSGEDSYLDDSREEGGGREGGEGEGVGGGGTLFSYFSPPRSAGSRHTSSATSIHGTRGVELERDFLLHNSTANEQGLPHSGADEGASRDVTDKSAASRDIVDGDSDTNRQGLPHDVTSEHNEGPPHDVTSELNEGPPHDVIDKLTERLSQTLITETTDVGIPMATGGNDISPQLNQTRLSDDYDWRQYASQDDSITQTDTSLFPHSHPSHPHTLTSHHGKSTSNEMDASTLSESMTLGEWTDRAGTHSLLDSLDTRDMGGALSPAAMQPPNQLDSSLNQSNQSDEELELMYDPQLQCFYDPKTLKYYELIQ